MLKRKFYDSLLEWKSNHGQECLLVKGARQVGKTFIIDYFGNANYSSYLYLNFVLNKEAAECFGDNLDADVIFKRFTARYPRFKLIPGDTLVFLDEIQACPRARTALKSLAIDGRADVVASGSLLGINFLDDGLEKERAKESIPVGYENQVFMRPMDFEEFLWALGYGEDAVGILRESFDSLTAVDSSINEKFLSLFREYVAVGGMPEVVSSFIEGNSFSQAYKVQEWIKNSNLDDIARYAARAEKPKVRACYLSLPSQLARENKKFKYSEVGSGGSARKFGNSVAWLRESALGIQCFNTTAPSMPLNVYRTDDCFKMYVSDVGILTSMMGFEVKKTIVDNTIKGFAKGGLYENAVIQQLVARGYEPCYHQRNSSVGEIDFLIERDGAVIPIEVKAGHTTSESFDRLLESDDVQVGYKFIRGNVGRVGKKITLPHYMTMFL
ncbi:MAG: ATP-binding protein [Kiritimatiellae bacterium]|nr:ATP-binding protein [Kiritimatiellia bacterium]